MTTSTYNAAAAQEEATTQETLSPVAEAAPKTATHTELKQTWASSSAFVLLSVAIILSTLAYGTVHYWTLAFFQAGAALLVIFWALDGWQSGTLRLSRNPLQWPLVGLLLVGAFQLLPLGSSDTNGGALSTPASRTFSLDPYSTRFALVQIVALLIYFAAALAFTDSPRRLRRLTHTITIFGFALALFGLVQHFMNPTTIYWIRELPTSTPFGPFINRHHFAGYMELALALPLGLLLSGAVERDKRLLYLFAVAIMGLALIMTNSRGGITSFVAEVCVLAAISGFGRKKEQAGDESEKSGRARTALLRVGLALSLLLVLFAGVVLIGGEPVLSRLVGTVNTDDPTTGRAHFWSTTLKIISEHPLIGAGLGAFGLAYTRYDTRNGLFRLEQAHNDYLQVLADAGVVGALLGLFFIVALFRLGFQRRETEDLFRRGVATGALAGCFAVLVHSFFDFTLHTTSNALLFLVLAALATLNGRVEQAAPTVGERRRRRRRRHSRHHHSHSSRRHAASASPAPEAEKEESSPVATTVAAQDKG